MFREGIPFSAQITSLVIKNLRNKLVLVTGAGSGIGRSTALAFAERGSRIIATDIAPAPLEALRLEIERFDTSCATYTVDVSDEAAMKRLAEEVNATFGALDVLVNNAGIGYLGPFLESDLAHWPRVLGVNVMGVVYGCHNFLPAMIDAGGARHVLIVASAAANYPPPSVAAYAASKFAAFGFAEVLKMELSDTQVSVTTVCPGVINTAIVRPSPDSVSSAVGPAQRERLQAYYAQNGVSPDVVGQDMVRAVEEGTDLLLTGPAAKLTFTLRRLSLGLARRLTWATAKRVGYRA